MQACINVGVCSCLHIHMDELVLITCTWWTCTSSSPHPAVDGILCGSVREHDPRKSWLDSYEAPHRLDVDEFLSDARINTDTKHGSIMVMPIRSSRPPYRQRRAMPGGMHSIEG
jgi:hypothetical protein